MSSMQDLVLVCDLLGCPVDGSESLTLCSGCRIQGYCGMEHQKADWRV